MKIKIKYAGVIETEVEVPDELSPELREECFSMLEYIKEKNIIPMHKDYSDNAKIGDILEYKDKRWHDV